MVLALIAVLIASAWPAAEAAATAAQPAAACQRRCGDVDIPYPFGIGRGCYLYTGEGDVTFGLTCNLTADGTYRPFCWEYEVLGVSLRRGQARVRNDINPWCYNATSRSMDAQSTWWWDVSDSWFHVSDEDNRLTVVGCNSLAYVTSVNETEYMTGCMATCPSVGRLENGSCSGMGCCQAAIPRGINSYWVEFEEKFNTSGAVAGFGRCSYAVLLEAASFEFRTTYVTTGDFVESTGGKVPLVLDWVVGKETCREARRNATAFMCVSRDSECVDSRNGPGYLCNCSAGFEGNPYLLDGCQDINECEDRRFKYPCSVPGTCINTPGGFRCSCPDKTTGNAYYGTCEANKSQLGVHIAIGVSVGLALLAIILSSAYMIQQRRRLASVKRRYFKQHGGLLLFEEMKSNQGLSFTLFTEEELEEATDRFDERNVLGKGGNGTVYRGALRDGRAVAIKRCKLVSERQKKEFGKEMLILSQVNHRSVVKLHGCCLEVEVPMLVYELVPHGTLYQLIHGDGAAASHGHGSRIPFATRLKIAHEAAEALAYLHSWASPPIIHGDVKSPNMLIDDGYAVKVSDFGASTLAPTNEAQFVTLVQGTCGYLDPEYMQTCKLTDKSDVYSFGVVLLELLTCRKALNLQSPEEEKNLSSHFLQALGENRLEAILDSQILGEESMEVIEQVAGVARQCLEMSGERRPSMRQVAEELGRVRKLSRHPWRGGGGRGSSDELEKLLAGRSPNTYSELQVSNGYLSLNDSAYIGIQSPR
ncbi:wall-associated receptor kinase 2-like [Oryza brachyantha]|uniref:Protein kinase domain-containing protein n=1 Tax=Oryza brachyantha TaxID=4533 RepID=J3LEY1_ORYBR|nr:wall-associated receptor kinase 2-like [Oryza brachyantha]